MQCPTKNPFFTRAELAEKIGIVNIEPEAAASLRDARKMNRLSQTEFATRVGVRQSTVANYEQGRRIPDLVTAKKMGDVLGLSLDDIFKLLNISYSI